MKTSTLVFLMITTATAVAHELDNENTTATATVQAEVMSQLPQTTIIRVSKADPSKVEVLHLDRTLAQGEKLTNGAFEQVAINTEIQGVKFNSSNELDATSSTSSWRWGSGYYGGYGYGVRGGAAVVRGPNGGTVAVAGRSRYGYGYGAGYRGGVGYNDYGYSGGSAYYSVNSGCDQYYGCASYYPTYRVRRAIYRPVVYATYEDNYYNYDCYGFGY